jgi:hypothetical protein
MTPISFKRHRFPPAIIQYTVWLYARFTLSFRDVEDVMTERGIEVSNETVRRWFVKFGRLAAANLRRSRPVPVIVGTSTRWSSESAAGDIGFGGQWTTKARCLTSWFRHDAAPNQRDDYFESC